MIRTLRIIYLGRPAREKILVLALLVALVALWLSGFTTRAGVFISEQSHTSSELKTQAKWLANQDRIEKESRDQAAQLDPTQTLDGPRLNAALASMANDAGLGSQFQESANVAPVTTGQFTINTVDITISRASWDSLKSFYTKVQSRAPYISVESISVAADPAGALLTANLKISAFEVARN